jgi:5,10-methylenetetrahydromethanopterin reductase
MSLFKSVGVGFGECDIHDFLSLTKLAESTPISSLWVQEGDDKSALTYAAAALQSTSRIKVGVGVTSPFRRHPQILAIETATLSELSRDRFILGLGVASGAIGNYGVKTHPLTAMRDTIEIIRGLLSDKISDFSYNGSVFSLNRPQKPLICHNAPIYLGAIGPGMLDLAGEMADGLIMTRRGSFSKEYIEYAIERVITSARKHGRDPDQLNFLGFFETFVSEQGHLARQFAKKILGTYTIPELPSFVSDLARIDANEIHLIKQRHMQGDFNGAIAAVTEEMVDKFAIAGTPPECLQQLQRFTQTGLKAPILYIHGPDKRIAVKLVAEQILPRIVENSSK